MRRLRAVWRSALVVALVVALSGCGGDEKAVVPVTPPVVITTSAALPQATVGVPYDVSLTATGGTGTYSWELMGGTLPDSLTLTAAGRLSGMPLQVATQSLSVKVSSGSVTSTTGFTLTVVPPPLVIITSALSDATLGVSYNAFLDVSGGSGPVTWSLASGALPAGLSLMTSGVILGNPTALGDATIRVRAERGPLSAERGYTLRVLPPTLRIVTTALPNAKVGERYTVQLQAAGGVGGNAWSIDSGAPLPAGLSLSPAGLVDGTPTAAGTTSVAITVRSGTQRVTAALSLTVDPAGFPSSVLVTMPGNVFVPLLVQLARGGTVTWRFGATPHNVIFGATAGAPADINITNDQDVSRTFPTLGTFRYDCTIHPGMSGVVEVKP